MGSWVGISASDYVDDSYHKRELVTAAYDENVTHSNISFNGSTPSDIVFNGSNATTVYFNGAKVFWHESIHHTAVYNYYKYVPDKPTVEITQDETGTTASDGAIGIAGEYTVDSGLSVSSIVVTIGGVSANATYSNGAFSANVTQSVKSGSYQAIAKITDSAGQTASSTWYGTIEESYQPMRYLSGSFTMSGSQDGYTFTLSGTWSGWFYPSEADAEAAYVAGGPKGSYTINTDGGTTGGSGSLTINSLSKYDLSANFPYSACGRALSGSTSNYSIGGFTVGGGSGTVKRKKSGKTSSYSASAYVQAYIASGNIKGSVSVIDNTGSGTITSGTWPSGSDSDTGYYWMA